MARETNSDSCSKGKQENDAVKLLVLCMIMIISLIPVLILSKYAVQAADDYSFGAATHLEFLRSGNVFLVLKQSWDLVRSNYQSWQGTWSAIFLMTLQPAVFSFHAYPITTFVMLSSILSGVLSLCICLFKDIFKMNQLLGASVGVIVSIICVQLMPSPVEGLYWYNGAVYYTFFHGICFLSFALLIGYILRGGKARIALLTFLFAFLGGGNYPTALCSLIVLFSVVILLVIEKKNWQRLLVPLFALAISFAISITAPGNHVRMMKLGDMFSMKGLGVTDAIMASFRAGIHYSIKWFSIPMIGSMLLVGVLFFITNESNGFHFPHPELITIFSFCLISAMFCPSFYSMGIAGPNRLINIIFYSYSFLLAINVCYWLGWIRRRLEMKKATGKSLIILTSLLCAVCWSSHLLVGSFTATAAIGELKSGEASEYYSAQLNRLIILEDTSIREALLDPLPCVPFLLYSDDISENSETDYINLGMAQFYGKDSVSLKKA